MKKSQDTKVLREKGNNDFSGGELDLRTTAIRDLFVLASLIAFSFFSRASVFDAYGKLPEYARYVILAFSLCWFTVRRLREWEKVAVFRKRMVMRLQESEEELKHTVEKLNQALLELKRSNEDLEQFAYVASHDLQEPLRKIQAFGERLKTKCNGALGDHGRDYLERMQNAAQRMRALIEDLLEFSRLTTKGQEFVPVNLNEVAEGVVSDLETLIQRTGGRVEVGELPTIKADRTQMRQLIQNLVGNGLKFRRVDVSPVVKVSVELKDEGYDIVVEDNGIGFDERHLDRIFAVFQRLHKRDEYEGTGIGLALCRKIAQRHGGDITARSKPGDGAKFIVTLPVEISAISGKERAV